MYFCFGRLLAEIAEGRYSKYGTEDIAITYEDTGNGTSRLGNIKQPTIKP